MPHNFYFLFSDRSADLPPSLLPPSLPPSFPLPPSLPPLSPSLLTRKLIFFLFRQKVHFYVCQSMKAKLKKRNEVMHFLFWVLYTNTSVRGANLASQLDHAIYCSVHKSEVGVWGGLGTKLSDSHSCDGTGLFTIVLTQVRQSHKVLTQFKSGELFQHENPLSRKLLTGDFHPCNVCS